MSIERLQRAIALGTDFLSYLEDRKQVIIKDMVQQYSSGDYNYESLIGCIAKLHELQRLKSKIENERYEAIDEVEEMTNV